ncbi:MAG: carbonic anhydrase, partial [Chthoniobacteraceae bacterium]
MKTPKLLAFILTLATAPARAEPTPNPLWQRLLEGNARFVAGQLQHPHQDAARRSEVATGQQPFAVVIGCSDSRTSPEILFDQGLGDLFVVRLAGNIVDDAALGSVEFAVASLGARLIVVLGHEKCGAVKATVETVNGGARPPGHIGDIVDAIRPAALVAAPRAGDPVENAIGENVREVVARLQQASPVLAPFLKSGELQVVGARYDLAAGQVQL